MSGEEFDLQKVKVALCPTCGGWITQSAFPRCETSKDSIKEFRACIKAGLTIDVVTLAEAKKLTYCYQDHDKPRKSEPAYNTLFDAVGDE